MKDTERRRGKLRVAKLALLLASSVFSFFVAELIFRQLAPEERGGFTRERYVSHGNYYSYPPDSVIEHENERGQTIAFRTDEFGLRNPATLYRSPARKILVLGDSFIEASSTPDPHTITASLRRQLVDRGVGDIEVVNAGISGYSNDKSVFLMHALLPEVQPSIVILMVYLGNDLRDNYKLSSYARIGLEEIVRDDRPPEGAKGLAAKASAAVKNVAKRSRILTRLYHLADPWDDFYVFYTESLRNRPAQPVRQGIENTRFILGSMAKLCESRRVDCLVFGIPTKAQVYREFSFISRIEDSKGSRDRALEIIRDENGYSFDRPAEYFREACAAVGLPYHDLTDLFREHSDEELYYKIDRHWTATAQALAARRVAAVLLESSLP